MGISIRDLFYSIILHAGLLLLLTFLNPFMVSMRPDFEAVSVNIIEFPPLGMEELARGDMPEISIPQALSEDEIATPIVTPESRQEPYEIEKKVEEQPKPKKDTGYKGFVQKGDKDQKGGTDISDKLGPGTKFGSVAVDNASFNYPYYFVQAFGKIQRNWSNPVAAHQPLSCVIYFQIIRSGTALSPEIEKSSGVPAFDRACLRAVQASSPLPPLPTDFRDDIIGIHLEFPYEP
jgi:TonB family protein